MKRRENTPRINTDINRYLISGQMQTANVRSGWRAPDIEGVAKSAANFAATYYKAEKDAAFKRLDLEASKMQIQELENIRVADSNEKIPEIENQFKTQVNEAFAQDNWGKQWLKERGDLFFAANGRDVMRAGIAKQHELYTLELNKTLGTWANDIATSAPDKAKVLMNDMNKYISASELLSPEEKQKSINNTAALVLQRTISSTPSLALEMLDDESYGWAEKGIDVEKYKQTALASFKNADDKRLISQIQSNSAAANELLAQSQERRLSIDEINKAVPETSSELRALLYDMNGYSLEDGVLKMTDSQKAIANADIYGRAVNLANNKNASINDWQKLENDIYTAMRKGGSLSKSEGQKILNMIATPYVNSYKDKLEDAESFRFVGPNYGFGQVEKLASDLGLNQKFGKEKYKDKTLRDNLQGQQAREKIKIFQTYGANLENALKKEGLKSIDELQNWTSKEREVFYQGVYDATLQSLHQAKFSSLQGLLPEKTPNAVVGKNDSTVSSLSTDVNKSKDGTPVNSSIKQVGTKGGKYYAKTSDGKTIEITENQYNQYRGL